MNPTSQIHTDVLSKLAALSQEMDQLVNQRLEDDFQQEEIQYAVKNFSHALKFNLMKNFQESARRLPQDGGDLEQFMRDFDNG